MSFDVIDALAVEKGFSGVISVSRGDSVEFATAYGLAHRGFGIPNELDTRFAIASGTKGLTALAVMSLVSDGVLDLTTTARSVLGDDLPLIDSGVTVEHLLAHRSGIGDYFDEDAGGDINDYALPVPVHALATTEQFLAVLDGFPTKFPPDTQLSYCNGGYVVLALIAERTSGIPFHDLVRSRVCEPANMGDTEFLRSDELPGRTALGYLSLDGSRTNVHHLPVRGNGDGGIYSTVADFRAFWTALFEGRIVPRPLVDEMVRPRSSNSYLRCGLGFWMHVSRAIVRLEGYDAGVSFRSVHDPASGLTYTVISNTSEGAWPIARALEELLIDPSPTR
ncbi:serine hydrolase domain-containing protein [Allokutzneria albata]|uniref:CubicO group peptidase, beta-lactamase class C family n=1 Tax=Allokutzneria albata TaxID=211114 RepID=A0A1H0ALQ0_ALLAB|nr:serine hydrolase domain-containing protein [Allokutzneria albata]SDN33756.1 CubicO group peptidase, beta-lactamase class C family [Allokutzneria albata]